MKGRLRVRAGFFVLAAVLMMLGDRSVLTALLPAALFHEMGHLATLYAMGGEWKSVEFSAGGAALHCHLPEGRFACAAVYAAGPAASLLLALGAQPAGLWRLSGASTLLGLFNLVPLPPLDGAMLLKTLCGGETVLCHICAAASGVALLAAGWYLWQQGGGVCLLLLSGALLLRRGLTCTFFRKGV